MDILIIGSGGREHAIALKLLESDKVDNLYCLPGNGGMAEIAQCVNIGVLEFDKIIEFLKETPSIGLTVVSPDNPLAKGLVDVLIENGFRAFGPTANAAQVEASKKWAKDMMRKYHIPTAKYMAFKDYYVAVNYVRMPKFRFPVVIKADGLALGKGVIICENLREAENAIYDMMVVERFGEAGKNIIIEEYLTGPEVSLMTFCDGKTIVPMLSAQDHKKVFDGNIGLNTGGMGAFCPSKKFTPDIEREVYENIVIPTKNALNNEGKEFRGVLYFGLMLTDDGVKVLEYNARFGDPETQVVLPLLDTDLFEIMNAVIDQKLDQIEIRWKNKSAVTVVLTSAGYPLEYAKGMKIVVGKLDEDVVLYHAGTKLNGELRTNGGRVMDVTSVGDSIEECRKKVYKNIAKINFDGMHFRKDIGIL